MADHPTFYQVIQAAIADLSENGFDTEGRLAFWSAEIRRAADELLMPEWRLQEELRLALGSIYSRLVEKGGIARYHPGVEKFTIDRLKPKMRVELDRRILASTNLIKLNRQESVDATIRRFQGWATSIPAGGQRESDKAEATRNVKKAMASLPFESRRVIIDQGMKLTSSINKIVAEDGGAIAGRWRSHWRQAGYNARHEHKERDEKIYLIRDSWAHKAGLVKPNDDGYTDQITEPGQEISCRCYYVYIYALKRLPDDMITDKGRAKLAEARAG